MLSSSLSLLRVKVRGIAHSNHMTGPKWRGGKAPQVALGLGTVGLRARQGAFWEPPVGIFQASQDGPGQVAGACKQAEREALRP